MVNNLDINNYDIFFIVGLVTKLSAKSFRFRFWSWCGRAHLPPYRHLPPRDSVTNIDSIQNKHSCVTHYITSPYLQTRIMVTRFGFSELEQ